MEPVATGPHRRHGRYRIDRFALPFETDDFGRWFAAGFAPTRSDADSVAYRVAQQQHCRVRIVRLADGRVVSQDPYHIAIPDRRGGRHARLDSEFNARLSALQSRVVARLDELTPRSV